MTTRCCVARLIRTLSTVISTILCSLFLKSGSVEFLTPLLYTLFTAKRKLPAWFDRVFAGDQSTHHPVGNFPCTRVSLFIQTFLTRSIAKRADYSKPCHKNMRNLENVSGK